jgi:hypothetical protein
MNWDFGIDILNMPGLYREKKSTGRPGAPGPSHLGTWERKIPMRVATPSIPLPASSATPPS